MLSPPRIYVDFNALEYARDGSGLAEVSITGYGTLASLSCQKLQLTEGLEVVIFEPENIESLGLTRFDPLRVDPAGRTGEWVVRIDPKQVQDCKVGQTPPNSHPCFGCGIDLQPHLEAIGRSYSEICPSCGTAVMAPLAPPRKEA